MASAELSRDPEICIQDARSFHRIHDKRIQPNHALQARFASDSLCAVARAQLKFLSEETH
jgi:hypothetical protein